MPGSKPRPWILQSGSQSRENKPHDCLLFMCVCVSVCIVWVCVMIYKESICIRCDAKCSPAHDPPDTQ